jgi:cell wall-associated NlpC family hydrolase
MSVPLRVAACATAMALTLTPEMAGSSAASTDAVVLQVHRHQDQTRQLRQQLIKRRHERHPATLRLRHAALMKRARIKRAQLKRAQLRRAQLRRAQLKRARMIARWHVRAERAVRFAYRQRGKPYRWGGTGPYGYDCSGLVQRAWRAAGVSIPRVTYGQYRLRSHISRHRLRPGDLVFFRGIGHVGIYIGHTRFIHSPHTGSHVKVERLSGYYRRAYVGAVRPAWPRLPVQRHRTRHHKPRHHKASHHEAQRQHHR